jgi:probable DNA metabolism protein
VVDLKIPEDFLYILSMHKDCSERLLAAAKGYSSVDLELSSSSKAVRLKKMVYAVYGELHRMKAFVRLKAFGDRALYGYMKPRNRIGPTVCEHFALRNPGMIIVLGNGRESWISLFWEGRVWHENGQGMGEALRKLESFMGADIELPVMDIDALWQIYYDSQYCPERKNPPLFRQRMPGNDQRAAGLRLVQNSKEVTLNDFLCTQ